MKKMPLIRLQPQWLYWFCWIIAAWLGYQLISGIIERVLLAGRTEEAVKSWQMQQQQIASPNQGASRASILALRGALFAPTPLRPELPQCYAIMGDSALIGDNWYKAGSTIQGITIVEVLPQAVKVKMEDNEFSIIPFETSAFTDKRQQIPPQDNRRNEPVYHNQAAAQQGRYYNAKPFKFDTDAAQKWQNQNRVIPEELRKTFEKYRNASAEEQARMREEFKNNRNRDYKQEKKN